MAGGVEIELKFILGPADFEALRAAAFPAGIEAGPAAVSRIVSTYYDTTDQRLRAADATVRVRDTGHGLEQTIKSGTGLVRGEITVPSPEAAPNLALFPSSDSVDAVRALLGEEPLQAQLIVDVERTTRRISDTSGTVAEYAMDRGSVHAGDRQAPICEVELELLEGEPGALFGMARALFSGISVRPSTLPKSLRGFRLLAGEDLYPSTKAAEPDIDPHAAVRDACLAVLASCRDQIAENILAIEAGDDPEGPHQLRVGLRRLRSALKVFEPVLEEGVADRLVAEARELGQSVGRVRDLDVLAEDIVAVCAAYIDVTALKTLIDGRRRAERADLLGRLGEGAIGALLIDLAAVAAGEGVGALPDRDAKAFARKAIGKLWRKTARRGRHPADLSPDERHRLRKSFKRLRYAVDSLGPLVGKRRFRRVLDEVKAAQEVLGYLNDVRNAEALIEIAVDETADLPRDEVAAVDRAVGFCLGWHRSEAARVWSEAESMVSLDPKAL